ncbi:MAG: hypothetical protein K2X04_07270 [Burkholderiales bacterium]|nr:hypothetical protein [Burkholderiales bacterium]
MNTIIISILASILTTIVGLNIQIVESNYKIAQDAADSIFNKRIELVSDVKKLEMQSFWFDQLHTDNMVDGDVLNNINFSHKVPESVVNELRWYEVERLFLFNKISLNYGESVNTLIDVYNSADSRIFIGPAHLWRLRVEMMKSINQNPVKYSIWFDLFWHFKLIIFITLIGVIVYFYIAKRKQQIEREKYLHILDQHVLMISNYAETE